MAWGMKQSTNIVVSMARGHEIVVKHCRADGFEHEMVYKNTNADGLDRETVDKYSSADGLGS